MTPCGAVQAHEADRTIWRALQEPQHAAASGMDEAGNGLALLVEEAGLEVRIILVEGADRAREPAERRLDAALVVPDLFFCHEREIGHRPCGGRAGAEVQHRRAATL